MKLADGVSKYHSALLTAFKATTALIVTGILVLWGWNEVGTALTGLPMLQFKDALAALSLIAGAAYATGLGLRLGLNK